MGGDPRSSQIRTGEGDMKTLTPENLYDPLEWEIWLVAHGFNIENVYQLDFHDDGTVTVHSYRRDKNGNAYRIPGSSIITSVIATEEPVTIIPKSEIPVWS